jgi:hypothetical protein
VTRREALVNVALLKWRVVHGRALPRFAMAARIALDRLALRLAERTVDRPWTPKVSARVDRVLDRQERKS